MCRTQDQNRLRRKAIRRRSRGSRVRKREELVERLRYNLSNQEIPVQVLLKTLTRLLLLNPSVPSLRQANRRLDLSKGKWITRSVY